VIYDLATVILNYLEENNIDEKEKEMMRAQLEEELLQV
jgi:hypothetical protein